MPPHRHCERVKRAWQSRGECVITSAEKPRVAISWGGASLRANPQDLRGNPVDFFIKKMSNSNLPAQSRGAFLWGVIARAGLNGQIHEIATLRASRSLAMTRRGAISALAMMLNSNLHSRAAQGQIRICPARPHAVKFEFAPPAPAVQNQNRRAKPNPPAPANPPTQSRF